MNFKTTLQIKILINTNQTSPNSMELCHCIEEVLLTTAKSSQVSSMFSE